MDKAGTEDSLDVVDPLVVALPEIDRRELLARLEIVDGNGVRIHLGDEVDVRRVVVLGIYLAIGATVLPSFFINAALHRISAQANATIGTLSPVATILLAVLILGEELTLADAFGAALVLAGVGWFALAERVAPA